MVDSHQVLIDNCNGNCVSTSDSGPNLTTNATPMNEICPEQSSALNGSSNSKTVENNCEQHGENLHVQRDDHSEIMCGTSPIRERSNNDSSLNCTDAIPNGNDATLTATTIESQIVTATNHADSIGNNHHQRKANKSNDSNKYHKESTTSTTTTTTTTTNNNSTDQPDAPESSVEFRPNVTFSVKSIAANKMDSRKVEPIRININRDPIKTKIKLGPSPHECQALSLKSSSSSSSLNEDECDNVSEVVTHENTQNYPKITIKPIVKPAMNHHNNQNTAGLQALSSSSSSSASHEAIPKLKIKKIESSGTANNQTSKPTLVAALNSDEITTNYQTHLLSESSTTVPT